MERVRTGEILLDNDKYFVELTVSKDGKKGAMIRDKCRIMNLFKKAYTYIPEKFCKISCEERGIKVYTLSRYGLNVGLYSYQGEMIIPARYEKIYMLDEACLAKGLIRTDIYFYSCKRILSLPIYLSYSNEHPNIYFLKKGIKLYGKNYTCIDEGYGFYDYEGNTIVPIEEGYSKLELLKTHIEAKFFRPNEALKYAWYSYKGEKIVPLHDKIKQIGKALVIAIDYYFYTGISTMTFDNSPYRYCKTEKEIEIKRKNFLISKEKLSLRKNYYLFSMDGKQISQDTFHYVNKINEILIVGSYDKPSARVSKMLYAAYSTENGKEIIPLGNHQIEVYPNGILVTGEDNPGFYEFKNLCM